MSSRFACIGDPCVIGAGWSRAGFVVECIYSSAALTERGVRTKRRLTDAIIESVLASGKLVAHEAVVTSSDRRRSA